MVSVVVLPAATELGENCLLMVGLALTNWMLVEAAPVLVASCVVVIALAARVALTVALSVAAESCSVTVHVPPPAIVPRVKDAVLVVPAGGRAPAGTTG